LRAVLPREHALLPKRVRCAVCLYGRCPARTAVSLNMLAVRSLNEPSHDVARCHVRQGCML
jgi:hypothetical protein